MKKISLIVFAVLMMACTQQATDEPVVPVDEVLVKKVIPHVSVDELKTIFNTATEGDLSKFYKSMHYAYYFGIIDEIHEDMYMATVLVEVGSDLVGVRENLNYSCSALPSMFSYYKNNGGYNTDGRCEDHSANQVVIGNKIYADRIGNGNVASGDGYRFRGGGYAQTTGRYNYQTLVDIVNLRIDAAYTADNFADNIHKPYVANLSGMGYWFQVNAEDCSTMDCVTDRWNKYTDSREERNDKYNWIKGL